VASCLCTPESDAFAPSRSLPQNIFKRTTNKHNAKQIIHMTTTDEWTSIIEDYTGTGKSPVQKKVLKEGEGPVPTKGSTVEIEYVGVLGSSQESWEVDDVIECWLKNLQGLYDALAEPMRENDVDGSILFDEEKFTEAFVSEELGVANRIQCKKTIMAAKRLKAASDEYPEGTQFDSSLERGKSYEFVLGQGKAIQAMELLVATMKVGEKAKVVCRSDFGYGSEGYRKSTGEVVVPPFATLNFEVTLVSAS